MVDRKPDLIVAVDFGMTCTGVAYANLTRSTAVRYIQKWPGRAQANENKVPTVVVYDTNRRNLTSWGFMSENRLEQNSPDRDHCDWFKLFVDPEVFRQAQAKDPNSTPPSQAEVDRWTQDYLRMLYQHIEFKLKEEIAAVIPWDRAEVEFIFSVPTTWALHPTIEKFRNMAKSAGFESYSSHKIVIGLTEAEAAAVHVAVEASVMFAENDVLLACDAGGGTTDLSVMKVIGVSGGVPELRQLMEVKGRAIGSAQIDQAFEDLVVQRLESASSRAPLDFDTGDAAWAMMKSAQYQDSKCCYGSPDDMPFGVLIPGLDPRYTDIIAGIRDGSMLFSLTDLQRLFDTQIDKLFELLDAQLQMFQQRHPKNAVQHLVLSGGLGNSAYVQRKLRERYSIPAGSVLDTPSMAVHVAPEPQLAVCKGLATDRLRRLQSGKAVLAWRCSRGSYGVVCNILYDPGNPNHQGCPTFEDPLNGKLYIRRVVDWFIRRGQPINVDNPIGYQYQRKLKPDDTTRIFNASVVFSDLEGAQLPYRWNDDVRVLCELTSDLSSVDEKKWKVKNRHWWQSHRQKYMRVDYTIKCVLGPADIMFELWHEGQKLSKDQPIKIEWKDAEPPSQPVPRVQQPQMHEGMMRSRTPSGNRLSKGPMTTRDYQSGNKPR